MRKINQMRMTAGLLLSSFLSMCYIVTMEDTV